MSNTIQNKLRTAFKIDKLGYALFHNWDYGLRFELSSGDSYIKMFTSAFDRSRELLEYIFNQSDTIYVLIRVYSNIYKDQKYSKQMHRLKRCGFKLPKDYLVQEYDGLSFLDDDNFKVNHYEYLLPIEINDTNYQAILWAICSQDLGIQPSAHIDGYFIDFGRQIIARPYDDRGMDIVAMVRFVERASL